MGVIPITKSKVIVEEIVPVGKIDPVTCKEKFKGFIDEEGNCLVRLILDSSNPKEALLKEIGYTPRAKERIPGAPPPTPTE